MSRLCEGDFVILRIVLEKKSIVTSHFDSGSEKGRAMIKDPQLKPKLQCSSGDTKKVTIFR